MNADLEFFGDKNSAILPSWGFFFENNNDRVPFPFNDKILFMKTQNRDKNSMKTARPHQLLYKNRDRTSLPKPQNRTKTAKILAKNRKTAPKMASNRKTANLWTPPVYVFLS